MAPSVRPIVVFGAGGHAKVVAEVARSIGQQVVAFVQEDALPAENGARGGPVMLWQRFLDERAAFGDVQVALAVGNNRARERIRVVVERAGFPLATLVHASAVVAPSATIGAGSVVMPLAVINPDALVGPGCIINSGAVVEHDCVLGPFVHISPNAALGGNVWVGPRAHVGLGAVALPGVQIGADAVVGAGGVVRATVADGITVIGVPARPVVRQGS